MINWIVTYPRSSACISGIFSLSFTLVGLKILFSFSCKLCLSMVQGTSTKIWKNHSNLMHIFTQKYMVLAIFLTGTEQKPCMNQM